MIIAQPFVCTGFSESMRPKLRRQGARVVREKQKVRTESDADLKRASPGLNEMESDQGADDREGSAEQPPVQLVEPVVEPGKPRVHLLGRRVDPLVDAL